MSISEEENHRRPSATTGRHSSRSVLRRKRNFAAVLHTSSTSEMKGNASSCSAWRTLGVERAKITLFLHTGAPVSSTIVLPSPVLANTTAFNASPCFRIGLHQAGQPSCTDVDTASTRHATRVIMADFKASAVHCAGPVPSSWVGSRFIPPPNRTITASQSGVSSLRQELEGICRSAGQGHWCLSGIVTPALGPVVNSDKVSLRILFRGIIDVRQLALLRLGFRGQWSTWPKGCMVYPGGTCNVPKRIIAMVNYGKVIRRQEDTGFGDTPTCIRCEISVETKLKTNGRIQGGASLPTDRFLSRGRPLDEDSQVLNIPVAIGAVIRFIGQK
ncbi:hypothetical protein SCLCIDRAFT_6229 [Scleroderma citrinum Foug A]|uniref:Uncharacterized protein n=1 Tax=Scleroderma citrinum Foug A TaxID=1036808 RepID=A0A0C3ER70_9AGAM|nr:hypothetical protein SCLCIDRAFT_6229 [Scleroderma citrinum Foug A]